MQVRLKNGKFAAKHSAVYRYVNRTGKTLDDYYKWASECGKRASFNRKNRLICEKFGIDSMTEIALYKTLEIPDGLSLSDLNAFILNESENPCDIAACYLEILELKDDSIPGFLNSNLGPVTRESFERWGDKNRLKDISPSWIKNNGRPIDTQAAELSEIYGREIIEEDIIQYLYTYKKGRYKSDISLLLEQYEVKFERLCGFRISKDYAEELASYLSSDLELDVNEEVAVF
ncbi:hypothetical protein LAG90_15660 [Marinilongibacter aquaticus]|uniref:hypothetical protein n=1 Tax=Marinilongibacter aquaticus TaxID=2975157 RepID=UPI0021BDD7CA|nr:hypothetical protein [Marinilongibacter aquaticus]UBM58240.1 hypothetical protein LAG90_15660 [Marinilongibacter aquaticus]